MTEPKTSTVAEAASWYARRGIHVFPVFSIIDTPTGLSCDCPAKTNCSNPGKHPRTRHGLLDATTDADQVAKWWSMWPHANIGIACEPTGWAVIDIDINKGGDESLHDLEAQHGQLPDTVRAITGGDGSHIIYKLPAYGFKSGASDIAPGVDTRGTGGYIVAAPSRHISGGTYVWEADRKPGAIPLADVPLWFLDKLEQSTRRTTTPSKEGGTIGEGQRDNMLASLAGSMRGRGHTEAEIYAALTVTNRDRVSPPLHDDDIRRIAASVARYTPELGGLRIASAATNEHAQGLVGREMLGPAILNGAPETPWLIDNLLVRGRIHMVYGEPETGKTIIALSWALQCVERGLHVLFIDEESGIHAVSGLLRDMGADPDAIDEFVHYFPFPGIDKDAYDALTAYAADIHPSLILFDSLTDMLAAAGLDENSGIEVTSWMNEVATALARHEDMPAVVLIDHVPKDTENIRYSVASRAKKAKSDVLWYVRKNNDFDREHTAAVDLERHKNRPGVLPKKVRYTVGGEGGALICRPFDISQDVVEARHPLSENFLRILKEKGPIGRKQMEQFLGGVSADTVGRVANELERAGQIERVGATSNMRFQLAASGESLAASGESNLPQKLAAKAPLYRGLAASSELAAKRGKERLYWQDKDEGPEEDEWHP